MVDLINQETFLFVLDFFQINGLQVYKVFPRKILNFFGVRYCISLFISGPINLSHIAFSFSYLDQQSVALVYLPKESS